MKKTLTVILSLCIISCSLLMPVTASAASSVVENAISWAIAIANDNSHGYSQSNRWGPDYDCSSFVISAFKSAGVDTGSATYTGNMRSQFTQHGFQWIPWSQIGGVSNLQRGDILLNEKSHTEIYLGNNQNVGAHSNRGYPQTGDQTGTEVSVSGYYYHPWDGVLRYNAGNNPTGCVDSITGGVGTVSVKGWTFDNDDLTQPLYIHIYVGGSLATPNTEGTAVFANASRPDVDNVYHVGEFHGFDVTIPTNKTGNQDIYIYAINIGGGGNVEIGHKTVYISPDTDPPRCNDKYVSQITQNSFRVNAVVSDNVGIKNVRVATWTGNTQNDLIWHDAKFDGIDTYYVDVNRADYSSTENSYYQNHFYIYDYAGNYISIACDQDYRVKSDTGQTVADGEYRIVTSISESKALDVKGANNDDGTNIQIYSNLNDEKQTFDIEYIGDGFYTIFSHYTGKALDVSGDTYLSGTNVMVSRYHEGANQQWIVKPTEDGYYSIVARSNGLALDVAYAKNEDGANVQVHTVNNSAAQKWKLRRVITSEMVNVSNLTVDKDTFTLNPEIQVIADDKALVLNKDYKVEVKGDMESGGGTVTVTGMGNYCDSVTKSFDINSGEMNVNVENNIAYLSWNHSDSVSYYDVSICNAETNELVISEKTENCKIDFLLESGVYYALISSDDGSINFIKYFYVGLDNLKYITYNNHKYILFDYSLNWNDAEQFAESIGGHLTVISSDAEQEIINKLIIQGEKNLYWIGLSDGNIDGNYTWITEDILDYTNWADGEPNNDGATSYEVYVQIYGKEIGSASIGTWNDAENCGNPKNVNYSLDKIGFIVEIDDYKETKPQLGDVNQDGKITVADAIEIQRHIAGLIQLDEDLITVADVDKSGIITVADAIMVQRHIANITTIS